MIVEMRYSRLVEELIVLAQKQGVEHSLTIQEKMQKQEIVMAKKGGFLMEQTWKENHLTN